MHGQRSKDTPLKNHCTFRMISSLSEKIALCGKLLYQTMHLIQRIQHELINLLQSSILRSTKAIITDVCRELSSGSKDHVEGASGIVVFFLSS